MILKTTHIAVLAYHSVSDGKTPISVTVAEFRLQMEYLKQKGFSVIDLKTYIEIQEGQKKVSGKKVLITFDDAYRDVYQNALPILKEFGFPSVMSVNPFYVGKRADFATRKEDKVREICSREELREMSECGITIVNHGFSHKDFTSLSESEIEYEYNTAKKWIEQNIEKNRQAEVLVFPHGVRDARVEKELEKLGARMVFSRRVDVYPNRSLDYFARNLNPLWRWMRENKKFLVILGIVVVLKVFLGVLLLYGIPSVGLPKDLFIPTGGDDYSYVLTAQNILSGRWFSGIDIIGYPPFIALVSLITGQTSLPGLALPIFITNIFVFSIGVSVLTMFIIKKFWSKNSYILLGGLFTIIIPYIWFFLMHNFTLVTTGGAIDHIGMSRSLQLFGLTVGSDWLGAFLVCSGMLLFLKKRYGYAGLFFGLSFLVRAQNLLFLIFLYPLLLFSGKIKDSFRFGIAGFIGGFLQLLSNFLLTGSPFIFAAYSAKYNPSMAIDGPRISSITGLPMAIYHQLSLGAFLLVLLVFFGLLVCLLHALRYFWKQKEIFYFLLISGVIIPFSLFGINATIRNPRYFLPFIPVFSVLVFAVYEVYFLKKKRYSAE